MDAPRYFVTYRHRDSGEVRTRPFGRFPDAACAERIARAHFGLHGLEVVAVRAETPIEAVHHAISRFLTRTARITLGIGLSLLAYHYLFRTDSRVGDTPLGKVTVHMALTLGFHGLLMIGALVFCWDIAFGEGPHNGR